MKTIERKVEVIRSYIGLTDKDGFDRLIKEVRRPRFLFSEINIPGEPVLYKPELDYVQFFGGYKLLRLLTFEECVIIYLFVKSYGRLSYEGRSHLFKELIPRNEEEHSTLSEHIAMTISHECPMSIDITAWSSERVWIKYVSDELSTIDTKLSNRRALLSITEAVEYLLGTSVIPVND